MNIIEIKKFLPSKYGEPLLDLVFDTVPAPLGVYKILDITRDNESLRKLSSHFSGQGFEVQEISINLVDTNVTFNDSTSMYLPLGNGYLQVEHSEYPLKYQDLVIAKRMTSPLIFTAPDDVYYLIGFHGAVSKSDVLQICGIEDKTAKWYEWLDAGGSPNVECYEYFLRNMETKFSVIIHQNLPYLQQEKLINLRTFYKHDFPEENVFSKDYTLAGNKKEKQLRNFIRKSNFASYFVMRSLLLAAEKGYMDVLKVYIDYPFEFGRKHVLDMSNIFGQHWMNDVESIFTMLMNEAFDHERYEVMEFLLKHYDWSEEHNSYVEKIILLSTPEIVKLSLEVDYLTQDDFKNNVPLLMKAKRNDILDYLNTLFNVNDYKEGIPKENVQPIYKHRPFKP